MSKLSRECNAFASYLAGKAPDDYVQEKYRAFHVLHAQHGREPVFDRFLVALASCCKLLTGLTDSYCRFFRRRGVLRKKLILLLAILESYGPFYSHLDTSNESNATRLWAGLLGCMSWSIFQLLIALPIFGPIDVLTRVWAFIRPDEDQGRAHRAENSTISSPFTNGPWSAAEAGDKHAGNGLVHRVNGNSRDFVTEPDAALAKGSV